MQLSNIVKFILIFLVYFISGKLGLAFATVNDSATAIWAPTGIAIASFLLLGKKIWPIIFLGAFFTNLTTAGTVFTSIAIATGNTLEGVIGAYLVGKYADGKHAFDRPRNIFLFTILAGFLATLFSAAIGVTALSLLGFSSWDNYLAVWQTWWLGDAAGALVATPLIVLWATKPLKRFKHHDEVLESLFVLMVILLTGVAVFSGFAPYPYLCIPVLMWISFRYGQRAGSTAVFLLSLVAIWYTLRGFGPYVREENINQSLLLVQAFLGTAAVTTQVLAALVTERRRVEERLQSTVNNMREGFQIIGFDYKYLYVNDAAAEQGKRKPEDLLGHTMMELYPGIDKTEFFVFLEKCMLERVPHTMENEFKFPDGGSGWFALKIEPISEGALILSVDISQQKMAQDTLAREKAEDEALLASIGDGIIATDSDGKIIMVNKAFEEHMGFSERELLGKQIFEKLLIEDEKKNVLFEKDRPLTIALRTGKKITATHYLVRKNGTKFPAIITAAPVVLDKKTIGAVKVFHDITKEKEIDEMKTEFIFMTSHELRTPLSAIKGFVSMINKGDYGKVEKKLERPLQLIAASTERIIHIVNEMLNVSRIEAGRIIFNLDNYIAYQLVEEAVLLLNPLDAQNMVKINVKTDKSLRVRADKEKVIEILNNLIGNALKFTEKGNVSIHFEQKNDKVIIFVSDTGIGIAPEDQPKLFSKFEQVKSKKAGKIAGMGLGLYISRELARKMGGDLWIDKSEVGKGSTFALSLPHGNSATKAQSAQIGA